MNHKRECLNCYVDNAKIKCTLGHHEDSNCFRKWVIKQKYLNYKELCKITKCQSLLSD